MLSDEILFFLADDGSFFAHGDEVRTFGRFGDATGEVFRLRS
jgi:hypothetical protein